MMWFIFLPIKVFVFILICRVIIEMVFGI